MGGIQGFPASASWMAAKTAIPCLAAVEAYPRIAYRSRVVFSERSRPLIFCWVLEGRRSRSALSGYPDKADYAEFGVMRTRRWMRRHAAGADR